MIKDKNNENSGENLGNCTEEGKEEAKTLLNFGLEFLKNNPEMAKSLTEGLIKGLAGTNLIDNISINMKLTEGKPEFIFSKPEKGYIQQYIDHLKDEIKELKGEKQANNSLNMFSNDIISAYMKALENLNPDTKEKKK